MSDPASFMESGFGGAVDYRIGRDTSGPPNNWRRQSPPAAEDGTIPDLRFTVDPEDHPPLLAETGGGIDVTHPIYPSTFDFPDSEWG